VSVNSVEPLRGILEVITTASTMRFELTEEIAHSICTNLERFLTQPQGRKPGGSRYG
jgi:hypothetical protein